MRQRIGASIPMGRQMADFVDTVVIRPLNSVKQTRRICGDMSNAEFWNEVNEGHFEPLLGSVSKRLVTGEAILRYIEHLKSKAKKEREAPHLYRRSFASKPRSDQPTA